MADYVSTDPGWKKPQGDTQRYRWDGTGWSRVEAEATPATPESPRQEFPTWAERAGVTNPVGRGALDITEALAALPANVVFGGADKVRALLDVRDDAGQPVRAQQQPWVRRLMQVPDSGAVDAAKTVGVVGGLGAAGYLSGGVLPLLTELGGSYAVGSLADVLARRGVAAAGGSPEQQAAAGDLANFAGGAIGGPATTAVREARPWAGLVRPAPVGAQRQAAQWAVGQGLPVDVPAATGNQTLRAAQRWADTTIAGSPEATRRNASAVDAYVGRLRGVAGNAPDRAQAGQAVADAQRQAKETAAGAMQQSMETVLDRTGAPSGLSRGQAGQQVRTGLQARATKLAADARQAFEPVFKGIDRAPVRLSNQQRVPGAESGAVAAFTDTVNAPIDAWSLVESPEVRRLWRQMQGWSEARRAASSAYTALKNIMDGPRFIPADSAILARTGLMELSGDNPLARDVEQGLAANLVGKLTTQIEQALQQHVGPQAVTAWRTGRALHGQKMRVVEVLDALHTEGTQAFSKLTASGDRWATFAKDVDRLGDPTLMPLVGRTLVERKLAEASPDGVLDLAQAPALGRWWRSLGDDVKASLFKSPADRRSLNQWFQQLERRTAQVGGAPVTGEGASIASRLLSSGEGGLARIEQLQALARVAPQVPELLGRTFVRELADDLAANPDITRMGQVATALDGLGARKLALLLPDAQARGDVQQLATVMRELGRNVNPSGTATSGAVFSQVQRLGELVTRAGLAAAAGTGAGAMAGAGAAGATAGVAGVGVEQAMGYVLARALRSPRLARLVVQGLNAPARSNLQTRVAVQLQNLLRQEGDK